MAGLFKMGLLAGVIWLTGCDKEEKQVVYLMLEGSPQVTSQVQEMLENSPQVAEGVFEGHYIVKVIPPETGIDHKITVIRPDPDIDIKIKIFNPYGRNLPEDVVRKLTEKIRRKLPEQFGQPYQ